MIATPSETAAKLETLRAALRALGFAYVSLDLAGYRTGSLNKILFPSAAP